MRATSRDCKSWVRWTMRTSFSVILLSHSVCSVVLVQKHHSKRNKYYHFQFQSIASFDKSIILKRNAIERVRLRLIRYTRPIPYDTIPWHHVEYWLNVLLLKVRLLHQITLTSAYQSCCWTHADHSIHEMLGWISHIPYHSMIITQSINKWN